MKIYYEMKVRSQYFKIIEIILMEMIRRFKETEFIEAVEACNSSSKTMLDFNTFIKLPGIFIDIQFFEKLKAKYDLLKTMLKNEELKISR